MRYAVIVTQKKQVDGVRSGPIHWLRRGTVVRVLQWVDDSVKVETVLRVFGVRVGDAGWKYGVKEQVVAARDIKTLPHFTGPLIEAGAKRVQRVREFFGV